MLHKASTTQSTQVTGPLIAVETRGTARHDSLITMQRPTPPGISLVFNREDNKRRSDPYGLIKPLIQRRSMETIDVKSPNERTAMSVPLKMIEPAQVVAKANSSHISNEKVFLKTNEYGNQAIRKTSSTAKSDRYVAKLITVKKSEYGHVPGLGTYSVCRKRSELDSEIEGLTPRETTPSIHVPDERAIENVARMESGRKAEEPSPKTKIDVTEKVIVKKNIYTSRIIRTKTSIVDITLEKQGVNDKESNEEIDTGCSIKKSVENIISKIVSNLKIKNEDPNIDKNVADTLIVAKQSSSNTESGRTVTKISSAEKIESICNTASESSSPAEIDRLGETFAPKKIVPQYIKRSPSDSKSYRSEEHVASENIVVTKTSSQSHSGHVGENILVKKFESEHIATKETTFFNSNDDGVGGNIPVKRIESENLATNESSSLYAGIELPNKELVSVKKSITLIESRRGDCETPSSILRTNCKAREYAAIKNIDTGRDTKETFPLTRSNSIVTAPGHDEEGATGRTEVKGSPFHIESSITFIKQGINKQEAVPIATKETRIDNNIDESSDAKMSKAVHNAVEAKYSEELVLDNKKEGIESKEELKTSDVPKEVEPNKSLTAVIKELLEDEDFVELKLYKPSSSSKK